MPEQDEKTGRVPIYRYTIIRTDQSERAVEAMQYELDGAWLQFDAPTGTVLSIREDLVAEISREENPIRHEEVDAL